MKDLQHPFSQQVTISKLTAHSAFLRFPDKQELEWDLSLLPTGVKEGDTFTIIAHDKERDQEEREKMAKQILNELFADSST